jgi:hypothetical protein
MTEEDLTRHESRLFHGIGLALQVAILIALIWIALK